MSHVTKFGQTSAERMAEESAQAHEIVREITADLQVSQRQILLIIHGLALTLEDGELMQQIASIARGSNSMFLIDQAGGADGQSNR